MATFYRIKAKQRRELQRAIMRSIQKYGLVDTYAMKDSVRVMTDSRVTFNGVYIKITALYYYRFHDTFASDGFSTSNGINPVDITYDAFRDPKVQQTLADIQSLYIDWLTKNNSIFAVADIEIDQTINVGFEFFGSDNPKWNKAIASAPL